VLNILKHQRLNIALAGTLLFLTAGVGYADTLWNQALPTTNLNNISNPNRSNVAVQYGTLANPQQGGASTPFIVGDAFTLSGTTNTIDSVTIYEVGNLPDGGPQDTPTNEFSNISLFIGPDGSDLNFISNSFSAVQVHYVGAIDYQSVNNPAFYPIWAITFSGLGLSLAPGVYDYAIGATPIGGNIFALHASDGNLGGAAADESGGLGFFQEDGAPGNPWIVTYGYAPGTIANYQNPGQNVDVNVLITGTSTPEPGTFLLFGLGFAGVLARRLRRS
jgi:PEP-CTERM motif